MIACKTIKGFSGKTEKLVGQKSIIVKIFIVYE